MKTTLSSPNCVAMSSEKLNTPTDTKQLSPSASPRTSPRPSPRPQTKREHTKSDHLTVNYKETTGNSKHDGSASSQEGSFTSRSSNVEVSPEINKPESSSSSNKDRKETRAKKKSWFNPFSPTYKSKSGDFKRLFKDIPDDERLVVDYSCALQRDILLQGRIYVTQNYICFHSNIFGWENVVTLKWKEVSAITKEKTAIVIPNAITIHTRGESYFFTTFHARDKTFLMLFRVWQNALMDQPMQPQEMWQWVHLSYGEDLGLTSDDEDYVAPRTEEDKLSARLSIESFSEQEGPTTAETVSEQMIVEEVPKPQEEEKPLPNPPEIRKRQTSASHIPTDYSDTTESDVEKQTKRDLKVTCTSLHEGRQVMSEIFQIHIDQLFTLLFTTSEFFLDFHRMRKSTDLTQTPWTQNSNDCSKNRVVSLTLALNQPVGPKTAQVTENQVLLPCSKAGHLYAIDVESLNAGIPYADSFKVVVHHCLQKVSETESSYQVYAQVIYRKSVWGLVKGMIEKTCWSGLEDFFTAISKSLHAQVDDNIGDTKLKTRRKRRIHSMPRAGAEDSRPFIGTTSRNRAGSGNIFSSDFFTLTVFTVLVVLVVLNVMLYVKLWSLEESPPYTLLDLHVLKNPPKTHDDWIKLLQQQETLHSVEIQKWQRVLNTAIQLLKQTEESLSELQRSIGPAYTNKVMSILQNHKDSVENREDL